MVGATLLRHGLAHLLQTRALSNQDCFSDDPTHNPQIVCPSVQFLNLATDEVMPGFQTLHPRTRA